VFAETRATAPPMVVRNEFSIVELSYVENGDGLSLVVSDAVTGDHVVLNPTALVSLARSSHESFRRLLRAIDDHHDNPG
jgi:hypothetical protein